jgi:hypothetical protein
LARARRLRFFFAMVISSRDVVVRVDDDFTRASGEGGSVRLRERFDGLSGYVAVACLLLFVSVLGLLIEAQSSDKVLWTGTKVVGSEHGGIVFYRYQGQQYSLDGTGFDNKARITVYFDPSNPDSAQTDSLVVRAIDLGFTALPFTLAFLVVGRGMYRRKTADKGRVREVREYGGGLDPEYVENYLKRLRQRND